MPDRPRARFVRVEVVLRSNVTALFIEMPQISAAVGPRVIPTIGDWSEHVDGAGVARTCVLAPLEDASIHAARAALDRALGYRPGGEIRRMKLRDAIVLATAALALESR